MYFFVNSFFTKKIIEAGTDALLVKGTRHALTEPLVMPIHAPLLGRIFHAIVCYDISISSLISFEKLFCAGTNLAVS
jgi:hypothetical protein